jgi:hypothetical protein
MKIHATAILTIMASIPASASAQPTTPQTRSPWADSTGIKGVAERVMPTIPDWPANGQQPDSPASPPGLTDFLALMNGSSLYIQPYAPYNLPSFIRVVFRDNTATVQWAADYSVGGATPWTSLCTLDPVRLSCSALAAGGINAGFFNLTSSGIAWRYPGQTPAQCNVTIGEIANGAGSYSYQDRQSRLGEFFDHAGSGLSGFFFQQAFFQRVDCGAGGGTG